MYPIGPIIYVHNVAIRKILIKLMIKVLTFHAFRAMLLPSGHDGGVSKRLLRFAINLLQTRHGAAERDFRVARKRRICARNNH